MLTAQSKLKQEIINLDRLWNDLEPLNLQTDEEVEDAYDEVVSPWGARSEIRMGEFKTDIPAEYSRHYESQSVAMQCVDGSWIGWTYWYGGGKHGEPEAIDWIEYAYDLDVKEEEKKVIVREFTKKGETK